MENNSNKVYNINEMRRALQKAYENGNRSVISKKLCEELEITDGFFRMYLNNVERLFKAVCSYVRVKNAPEATDDARQDAYNAIFPLWKEMLSCGEKDKHSRDLHCTVHDISNLVGFCQRFVNDANNVDFSKDFTAHKVWATSSLTMFRKKIETDLGIRIAQVEVLTEEQAAKLATERRFLNKIKKAMTKADDCDVQIAALTKAMATASDKAAREAFQKQISEMTAIVKDCKATVANLRAQMAEALAAEPEADAEKKPEPAAGSQVLNAEAAGVAA